MLRGRKVKAEDPTPEIYAAISLVFGIGINLPAVVSELDNICIHDIKIRKPKHEQATYIDVAIVQNERFWELNDALSMLFLKVENHLTELKNIATKYHADVYIDIAFYQHGNYPALIISGQNMKNIFQLEANISIDPF